MNMELYRPLIEGIWLGALVVAGLFIFGAFIAKIVKEIMED